MDIVKGGKIRAEFMQIIRRHCVALHAVSRAGNEPVGFAFTGGSALLWETMEGRFFVTAHHVWRALSSLIGSSEGTHRLFIYDKNGPILIHQPQLVDQSEELDLAVFTVDGINDFNPDGKSFLKTLSWPTQPVVANEMIVGCGYPAAGRSFGKKNCEQNMLFWAFMEPSLSRSGKLILLDGHGKGLLTYYNKKKPNSFALPGISGSPLFVLRHTLDWVGIVRSGQGEPPYQHSILATPSHFIGANGRIIFR